MKHVPNEKAVYIYGCPVTSVLSILRKLNSGEEKWYQKHCFHLAGSIIDPTDVFKGDAFQFELNYLSWLNQTRVPTAFVRYEYLWDRQDQLSTFLGYQIELPERKKRKTVD